MSEPKIVNLKRRITDEPPDVLVFSKPKRPTTSLHYVRRESEKGVTSVTQQSIPPKEASSQSTSQVETTSAQSQQQERGKRIFHLNRIPDVLRKRKGTADGIATFVEKRVKSEHHAAQGADDEPQFESESQATPLKRPSKNAAVKSTTAATPKAETEEERQRMEILANYMHQAALDEIQREQTAVANSQQNTQAKRNGAPKLTGQRSKEIHQRRVATNGSMGLGNDIEMDSESDYVYDTYVLAPTSETGASAQVHTLDSFANVGYLVISEQDESLWETYLEDEPSDKDWDTDEEDENAEDHYGADYPEDEVASDDEYDRNVYGYRAHGASDDEEWDEDTGAYSDDEYDRMMSPFKNKTTLKQFEKYLVDKDDSGEG